MIPNDKPILRVSQVAKYLNLSADRLRTYDEENLVAPFRDSHKVRLYSNDDVSWLECLRSLIVEEKVSIKGFKEILRLSYSLQKEDIEVFIKHHKKLSIWSTFSRMVFNPNYEKLRKFYS